ncbi:MAG: hypothetical protein IJO62_04995 [Clostridia bacterium]|nr:hypothetical protein [Clostridia bacterium]
MEEKRDMYINIIITEALCVVVILLTVLTLKYFFKSDFKDFEKWYEREITADTRIEEVIE